MFCLLHRRGHQYLTAWPDVCIALHGGGGALIEFLPLHCARTFNASHCNDVLEYPRPQAGWTSTIPLLVRIWIGWYSPGFPPTGTSRSGAGSLTPLDLQPLPVCLSVFGSTGRQEPSQFPWCRVVGPTAPSEALFFVDRCLINSLKGEERQEEHLPSLWCWHHSLWTLNKQPDFRR